MIADCAPPGGVVTGIAGVVVIEDEARAAHVAGTGQFAYHFALRRAAGSDAVNGGRERRQRLRSVGASEDHLLGARAASLVHLARQAEAVDDLVEGRSVVFVCRLGLRRLVGSDPKLAN